MNDWSLYWKNLEMWLARMNWVKNNFEVFEFTVEHFMWRN